jgi:hypothetical protein
LILWYLCSFIRGTHTQLQIVSLAQLILDDYYRTFTGFQILIEKVPSAAPACMWCWSHCACDTPEQEWLSFGHKFADRAAHYDTPHKSGKKRESSPIFHQFLECVWQLIQQYPHHFQFNGSVFSSFVVVLAAILPNSYPMQVSSCWP